MARNKTFTPASIDAHCKGRLYDPRTLGLMIEVTPRDKKVWKYERRVTGDGTKVRLSFGQFPACSMLDARQWADALNEKVEAGIDPREAMQAEKERDSMTVARAHGLYGTSRLRWDRRSTTLDTLPECPASRLILQACCAELASAATLSAPCSAN